MKAICAILVVIFPFVICESSFPKSIQRCKFGDTICMTRTINEVVKSSPGGISEIELGSIDPLIIGKATIEQGASSSPVNIKVRMKNANLFGIKDVVVTKVVLARRTMYLQECACRTKNVLAGCINITPCKYIDRRVRLTKMDILVACTSFSPWKQNGLGKIIMIYHFSGFEKDPKKSKFEIYGFCPSVTIGGSYQISGKVLVLPVTGQGAANISLYNNDISMKMVTHTENRKNEEYLVIDKIEYTSKSSRMFIDMDNLFNDAVISKSMNEFFNENQAILYQELSSSMNGIFGNILKKRLQAVFNKFPYKEMFLE